MTDRGLWIGLQRRPVGRFGRHDGTSLEYSAWTAEEPNNNGGSDNCGMIIPQGPSAGKWNDIPCDYPFNRVTACLFRVSVRWPVHV